MKINKRHLRKLIIESIKKVMLPSIHGSRAISNLPDTFKNVAHVRDYVLLINEEAITGFKSLPILEDGNVREYVLHIATHVMHASSLELFKKYITSNQEMMDYLNNFAQKALDAGVPDSPTLPWKPITPRGTGKQKM